MPYVSYSNFKGGYDTRRSEVTTQPGSLLLLQDGHINEGAEIEKRRAFLNASYRAAKTFGLEVVSPQVFTTTTISRARSGGIATLVLASNPPIGVFGGGLYGWILTVTGLTSSYQIANSFVALINGATITYYISDQSSESTTLDTSGTVSISLTGPAVFTSGFDNVSTVSRSETATTATLVLTRPPIVGVGDNIIVQSVGNSDYNGSWVVASVSGTTITFINNSGNTESSTPDTNGSVGFISWTNGIFPQTLLHPAIYVDRQAGNNPFTDGLYSPSLHDLIGVTCSTSFNGNAWVSATFSDGHTYVYWNAIPLYPWYAGTVLSGYNSVSNLAYILSTELGDLSGMNISQVSAGVFDVYSNSGISYSLTVFDPSGNATISGATQTITSGSGILTVKQTSSGFPDFTGQQAVGSFWITGGSSSGSGTIIAVKVNGVTITSGTVNFTASNLQTATLVANNINANVTTPQYLAFVTSDTNGSAQIVITAQAAGTTYNGYVIEVDCSGNLTVDNTAIDFSGGSPGSGPNCSNITPSGGSNILSGIVTCSGTNYSSWATAIAANIQAFSGTSGYTAFAKGSVVWVSKLTRLSSDSMPTPLSITTSAGTPSDAHDTGLTTQTPLNILLNVPINQVSGSSSIVESLNVSGGTPPYMYLWVILSDVYSDSFGTHNGMAKLSSTTNSTTVVQNIAQRKEVVLLQCQVTDSSAPKNTGLSPVITISHT